MNKVLLYSIPLLKVLLFGVFIILCFIPFSLIDQLNLIDKSSISPLVSDIFSETVIIIVTISALLMLFRVFRAYSFSKVFIVNQKVVSGFFKGSLIGFVVLILCAGLALLNGNVSFNIGNITIPLFIGYLIFYILVGIFEEFLFRSFPLFVFAERYPMLLSVLLTSLLFGLAHMGNEGFNWLAMLNITLAGVFFSIIVLLKRNIYWAVGIHFGWNFTQGVILGYKVSGTNAEGILIAKASGPFYLSGGSFGIESSIFCTVILTATIIYVLVSQKIEPIQEVLPDLKNEGL